MRGKIDKRTIVPKNEIVSRVMSANKSKNTQPEILTRRILSKHGFTGYRLHWKKVPGSPDIAYPGRELAIFVNGCFWHACPHCKNPLPKHNRLFWKQKFQGNKLRDIRKRRKLRNLGWKSIVVWECQIKKGKLTKFIRSVNSAFEESERIDLVQ